MHNKVFENWFKSDNNITGHLAEWNKHYSDICQNAVNDNIEIFNQNVKRFTKQFEKLSHARNPKDYVETLKDCAQEDMAASADVMQKIIHNTMETTEEFTKLCGTMYEKQQNNFDTDKSKNTKNKE